MADKGFDVAGVVVIVAILEAAAVIAISPQALGLCDMAPSLVCRCACLVLRDYRELHNQRGLECKGRKPPVPDRRPIEFGLV